MKNLLDWKSKEVVNVFDEVTLWSAPFGRMLLENIPMNKNATIVDIGFGTGFPLIELSQRFGENSKVYGIDIWEEGIICTKEKIKIFDLKNIEILQQSASTIKIEDNKIDLVTSNLGVNNFEEKEKVYSEIKRILKPKGTLSITTNPIGTFEELFEIFNSVFKEMNLEDEQQKLKDYIDNRKTGDRIIAEIEAIGLSLVKRKSDSTNIRFVDAKAVLDHCLIRIGFRESWETMIREEMVNESFEKLILKIKNIIDKKGEFTMTIPMLYLEFSK